MNIVIDDLSGPEIAAFLQQHVDEMKSVTPPESKHALDLDGLRVPEVTFWSMLDDGELVACGALKDLGDGHAELKSMRTSPVRKRQGVASTLMEHIIAEGRRMNYSRISLETGSFEFFGPARKLYEKYGFSYCGPFGSYQEDPNSVFMTKEL